MAAREIREDDAAVMWGLAELSKFFMVVEQLTPTVLFDHCKPKDITGLYSRQDSRTCNKMDTFSRLIKVVGWCKKSSCAYKSLIAQYFSLFVKCVCGPNMQGLYVFLDVLPTGDARSNLVYVVDALHNGSF